MFLHYSEGTFTTEALDGLIPKLTRAGDETEKIPLTDFAVSTTWVYCREVSKDEFYHGGKRGGSKFVTLEINVILGGHSASTKAELIKRATDAIGEYGNLPQGEPRRVYVLIRELAESNWGFDGQPIDLEADLRHHPADAKPL